MKIKPLRGTRDFYPENKRVLNYIFDVWAEVAESFGYEDFDGPLLEPADLWTLKSGAEIPEQMYVFKDKGGRKVAIRPELTPTLARMVAEKQKGLTKPIKWFSIPRCSRYEAPQSGRLREFFQLNVDCLGTDSLLADADVISTAIEIMKRFGCSEKDFYVRLNNRKLIEDLILCSGVPKGKLQDVSRLIDKKDKLSQKDFNLSLKDLKLSEETIKKLNEFLELESLDGVNTDDLSEKGLKGFEELTELVSFLSQYKKFIRVDFSIMRGFDYYTSTVFEVFDRSKEFRAIAGGGRYEDLVSDFGGEKCPGVGYGMGDVVLELFLKKLNKFPELSKDLDYFVAPISDEVLGDSIKIANQLRKKFKVELDLMGRNLKKQFAYANSVNAKYIVIVGPRELKDGKVTVKDLKSGKEVSKDIKKL